MPKARAPRAPWVEVCESPHTRVSPGWVNPCSGPTIWTMPWRGSPRPKIVTLCSAALRVTASTMARASGSAMSAILRLAVGT